MLSHSAPFHDDQRTLVEIIIRESSRLNAIVSNFLVYSREKSFRFVRVDLVPLLEDTLVLLANRSQAPELKIVRRYDVQQAYAAVDGDRMKQVFWNLLENAVRAMERKGTITVSLQTAGECWRIGIADTGPGVPAKMVDKIFEPFQSHFEGGTGLGLAIVYQIIQAHGAKIRVASSPEGGAEFVLEVLQAKAAEDDSPVLMATEVSHG